MIYFLMTLAGVVFLVFAAEYSARFWFRYYAPVYVFPPRNLLLLTTDSQHLPAVSPKVRFSVNRLGARGEEPPPDHALTYNILTCGGSAVECYHLDQKVSWPQLIQVQLGKSENLEKLGKKGVYVSSIGKSGITADALRYCFPFVLPRFCPLDVIAIMIGASAVNYWTQIGTPSQLPKPEPPWAELEWRSEHSWRWRPRESALAELYRRVRCLLRREVVEHESVGQRISGARQMRAGAKEMRDTMGDPHDWIQQFEQALGQAIETAKTFARHIVVIRQPWFDKADPTPDEMALFWHGFVGDAGAKQYDVYYTHRAICEMMHLITEATERVSRNKSVALIHPKDVMQSSSEHFFDHFHFTAAGALVFGEYVAQKILENDCR